MLLSTITAFAAVGSITEAAQQASVIRRQSQSIPGIKGSSVEMKDVIKTGAGKVGVTFADNTRMQVTEHSQLLIDEFVYDPNAKGTGKLAMKVALGTVRYASGAIAKNDPSKVNIRTPTATVGVRGTDFMSVVDELGRSTIVLLPSCPASWTDIAKDCVTGAISVSTETASVLMNRPFQATFVSNSGLAPSAPVILKLTEDNIKNLLIVSQPTELKTAVQANERTDANALDVDPLAITALNNALDNDQSAQTLNQDLLPNLLDQEFVTNIVAKVKQQISGSPKILAQPLIATPAPPAPVTDLAKNGLDVPVDTGPGLDEDGSKPPAESPKKLAKADDQNNYAQIGRDGSTPSQITIMQHDGAISNLMNFGGNTLIVIRQK